MARVPGPSVLLFTMECAARGLTTIHPSQHPLIQLEPVMGKKLLFIFSTGKHQRSPNEGAKGKASDSLKILSYKALYSLLLTYGLKVLDIPLLC